MAQNTARQHQGKRFVQQSHFSRGREGIIAQGFAMGYEDMARRRVASIGRVEQRPYQLTSILRTDKIASRHLVQYLFHTLRCKRRQDSFCK